MVFNVGQATVSRDISYLEPVVRMCIPIPEKMHATASKVQSIEDIKALIPGLAVLVDVSEQPTYRPQNDETQKEHYSGKAKRYTMKTQYATIHDGLILQTSTAVKGSKHDFAVFKEAVPTLPENLPSEQETAFDRKCLKLIRFIADSAYAGMDKIVPQQIPRVQKTKARKEADACRKRVQQGTHKDTNPRRTRDTPGKDVQGDGRQVPQPAKKVCDHK